MELNSGVSGDPSPSMIAIELKFRNETIPLSVNPESTIKELKSLLQLITGVLPRVQRLICEGKFLVNSMTLKDSKLRNGSELRLNVSQGLHQGCGPSTKEASSDRLVLAPTTKDKNGDDKDRMLAAKTVVERTQIERWKLTAVVALRKSQLTTIPDEVWACGPSIRMLDLSYNSIDEISVKIGNLRSIQRLFLTANDISDNCISWEGITSLKSLKVLSLDQNHLTNLPSSLGALTSLTQLHIANNKLTSLPIEIELLTKLEFLFASNNRLSSVPSSIGNCRSLIEIDLSLNLLVGLPETIGDLHKLKTMNLRNNGLKALPSTLFKSCTELSALDVRYTEITTDILHQLEGWQDFDERRRLRDQKQLNIGVRFGAEFDERADKS